MNNRRFLWQEVLIGWREIGHNAFIRFLCYRRKFPAIIFYPSSNGASSVGRQTHYSSVSGARGFTRSRFPHRTFGFATACFVLYDSFYLLVRLSFERMHQLVHTLFLFHSACSATRVPAPSAGECMLRPTAMCSMTSLVGAATPVVPGHPCGVLR